MSEYIASNIKCPFWREKQNDKYRIKCEGITRNTTIQLTFRGDKNWYIKDFCCKNYEKCKIYQMLNKKYEKTEG